MPKKNINILIIAIAFFSFSVLGMTNGLLGVAWPSIQRTFQLPLDAVGIAMLVSMAGYTVTSLVSGQATTRFGAGWLLLFANIAAIVGLLAQGTASYWLVFILAAAVLGSGNGLIDSGINIHMAPRVRAGIMSWLHASYGVGSTLGPLVVTGAIQFNLTWRGGYGFAVAAQVLAALVFAWSIKHWNEPQKAGIEIQATPKARTVRSIETLTKGSTWIYVLIMFASAGLEISAGQWAFSLFTLSRHVPEVQAGLWVSLYWLSFTIGRILIGVVVHWLKPLQLIRSATVLSLFGCVLFWWNPTNTLGFVGLAVNGFALAPIIPGLISNTPRFIGEEHAPNAIGFQVAAMSLSLGCFPALAGVLAKRLGLETLGPFLIVLAVLVLVFHEVSLGLQGKKRLAEQKTPIGE